MSSPGFSNIVSLAPSVIRQAGPEDIPQVVEIHRAAFRQTFLSQLGGSFLQGYYDLVSRYPKSIFLVSDAGNEINGFVSGYLNPCRFYAMMKRRGAHFVLPTLGALVRRPKLLGRVVYSVLRVDRSAQKTSPYGCELSSIAVRPASTGQGIGRVLISSFLNEAWRMGAQSVFLTTDAAGNEAANRFYRSMGFELGRRFEQYRGRPMNQYVIGNVGGEAHEAY